ncbi:MAG: polyphosphate kinase 1 [Phycisphaerae bacterium]|nr:polyphosphate kinase 1 [Tepidisphaeraceae bacterium]
MITPAPQSALTPPVTPPAAAEPAPAAEFLNRDLSWLEFNRRVLAMAVDDRTPLLERVRFLGIFTSNLDEYVMKRAASLRTSARQQQVIAAPPGVGQPVGLSVDGRTPAETLAAIRQAMIPMLREQAECFTRQILPALAANDIHLLAWDDLTEPERQTASRYFESHVFPVLTPLAVDPGSPFPFISNLSMSLGVVLHHPDRGDHLFARVKVPEVLPKWIRVNGVGAGGPYRFVALYDLIRHHLSDLFPDMAIADVMLFRLTRNVDVERDEEDADDLRELMQAEIKQRKFARVVRLERGPDPNPWIAEFLMSELELTEDDVYELPAELDYDDLRVIADLNIPRLRYEPWVPTVPPRLADEDTDIFAIIRAGDLLLHHPYESFSASVERFINTAAADPKVLAIKMTLYRTTEASPFVSSLVRAAEAGKQVVCLIELKARFDEERNIGIATALEKAGVHVLYGIVGLKTHTKTTLVVREDADGIRCYAHVGTGNYHATTAKLYTDLGLLTCDPDVTRDVVELFHYLTGRSLKRNYRRLLVAPVNMRDRFIEMIERETAHAKAGRPAQIVAKMNALEERKIIRALYDASQAGVKIELIVRGFCTLRPGVPGLSENIRVRSIIGRFLEHSRVYYFRNAAADPADGEFYIGSADWMSRNLLARVEAIVPIARRPLRERLWGLLQILLSDRRQAWMMAADGSYAQARPESDGDLGTHVILMNLARHEAVVSPEELMLLR